MSERSEQEAIRLAKLAELRKGGYPFPNDVKVTATAAKLLEAEVVDVASAPRFTLAGRTVQIRIMGKAAFAHLLDGTAKIQVYFKQDIIGVDSFEKFKHCDLGDILEVRGYLFVTKTGEKSVFAESFRLLTKCLSPLPEKWHGLSDVEARYRARHLDLIANPGSREVFRTRARIVSGIRRFLDDRGFLEVETPVLHYIPGGAEAKPFVTFYNALHCEMFLRVATEIPLKKLVVGGLERVYEIGRIFRNEGLSKKHNPEFTTIEFYQAYATFEDLMTLTEELYVSLARDILGSLKISYLDREIDLTPPWPRISMLESVYKFGGVPNSFDLNSLAGVQQAAAKFEVELDEPQDWGRCLEALWGDLVEPKLINPTFITHHPFSISPLARKNLKDPKVTDRFELIISGMEMANAFSELNDAQDQRERFEEQARRKAAGDEEAWDVDEDFLKALEYGLPPTAGEGIGIDRLVMLFTNSASIRDVVLFPQLKPLSHAEQSESEAGDQSTNSAQVGKE